MTALRRAFATAIVGIALVGCATTVDEPADGAATIPASTGADVTDVPEGAEPALSDGELIEAGDIDDTVPVVTTLISGATADLLPEMATEMSRLSGLIAESTGDDESFARIETIWNTIRPEIADTRPELLDGMGATVDMARTAVNSTRPADADKAFSILTDLVDNYFGE